MPRPVTVTERIVHLGMRNCPRRSGTLPTVRIPPGLARAAVAGTLIVSIEMWQMLMPTGDRLVSLLLGTVGLALAMLGPGLWSVDARLFGWKRVEAPPRKNRSNSP